MSAIREVRIQSIVFNGDAVNVNLLDGPGMEFASHQDVVDYANDEFAVAQDTLARVLVREWLRRDPDMQDPETITDTTLIYELDGTNPPMRFEENV